MEKWDWMALASWVRRAGFENSPEFALLAVAGVLALIAGLWWLLAQRRTDADDYVAGEDQFGLTSPINESQITVLKYLQNAFPEGMVLFRPPMARFVAVRKSHRRRAARRHLLKTTVDFLVCNEDGRPLVAFEVDAFRDEHDADAQRKVAEKSRLLLRAGVRLIRLKGALGNFPSASELRARLYESQRLDGMRGLGTASIFSHTGAAPSSFGHSELNLTLIQEIENQRRAIPISDNGPWQFVGKND